jgi:hypothetical protein
MIRRTTGLILLAAATACGGAGKDTSQAADSTGRDLQMVELDSTAPMNDRPQAGSGTATATATAPKPAAPAANRPAPVAMTLDSGTVVAATASDSLHSRHNKVGDSFHATVATDVKDARGRVVIPAGSVVTFKVAVLEPAENKGQDDGKLRLDARQITIDGRTVALSGLARRVDVEHLVEGRGVTGGDVAKAGGATAGGAVVGGVVGGKTGAIVGGVVGAGAGTAVAVRTADRDVVVRPGMAVNFQLLLPLTVTR